MLVRPNLWGSDSYYFAEQVCNDGEFDKTSIGSKLFFGLLPCSEFVFKLVLFFGLLIACLLMYEIGLLISKDYGWLAGFLPFLSNYWIMTFTNFEDDFLGIIFIIISLYFFIRAFKTKKQFFSWISLFFCLVAGLFWKGSFLYLVSLGTLFHPALLVSIMVFVFVLNNDFGAIINSIIPNSFVVENFPIMGVFYQLGLLVGLIGLYDFLFAQFLFWLVVVFLNEKFAVILTIFLVLGVLLWLEGKFFVGLKNYLFERKILILIFIVAMLFVGCFKLLSAYPLDEQIKAVKYAIELSDGKPIINDWSYGYWIKYFGGNPEYFGGYGKEQTYAEIYSGTIYLTEQIIPCELDKEFGFGFNDTIKVYKC